MVVEIFTDERDNFASGRVHKLSYHASLPIAPSPTRLIGSLENLVFIELNYQQLKKLSRSGNMTDQLVVQDIDYLSFQLFRF